MQEPISRQSARDLHDPLLVTNRPHVVRFRLQTLFAALSKPAELIDDGPGNFSEAHLLTLHTHPTRIDAR